MRNTLNKALAQLRPLRDFWWREDWRIWLCTFAFGLFVFNALAFYPGHMTPDSIEQLSQATGVVPYNDWHPPVMALVWSLLIDITDRISAMMLFQLALLWGSLLGLALYVFRLTSNKVVSIVPILVGIMPNVITISGVVWKDVQMAVALLACVTLLLYQPRQKSLVITRFSLVILLAWYALTLRYNAIAAVVPVIYYLLITSLNGKQRKTSFYILTTLAIVGGMFVTGLITPKLIKAQEQHPAVAVMIDDVLSLPADETYADVHNQELRGRLIAMEQRCAGRPIYTNTFWLCTSDTDRSYLRGGGYDAFSDVWVKRVALDPIDYISYRVYTFTEFVFVSPTDPYIFAGGVVPNQFVPNLKFDFATKAVGVYVKSFGHKYFSFLFEPWFWLLAASLLLVLSRQLATHKVMLRVLGISAILYIVAYFPLVVAVDYRYSYWSVLAVTVGYILFGVERLYMKSNSKKARGKS